MTHDTILMMPPGWRSEFFYLRSLDIFAYFGSLLKEAVSAFRDAGGIVGEAQLSDSLWLAMVVGPEAAMVDLNEVVQTIYASTSGRLMFAGPETASNYDTMLTIQAPDGASFLDVRTNDYSSEHVRDWFRQAGIDDFGVVVLGFEDACRLIGPAKDLMTFAERIDALGGVKVYLRGAQ